MTNELYKEILVNGYRKDRLLMLIKFLKDQFLKTDNLMIKAYIFVWIKDIENMMCTGETI